MTDPRGPQGDPPPGHVRVILFDGNRFATVDVGRQELARFPDLQVATVTALLTKLGEPGT